MKEIEIRSLTEGASDRCDWGSPVLHDDGTWDYCVQGSVAERATGDSPEWLAVCAECAHTPYEALWFPPDGFFDR